MTSPCPTRPFLPLAAIYVMLCQVRTAASETSRYPTTLTKEVLMKTLTLALVISLSVAFFASAVRAAPAAVDDQALGEQLVRQLWVDMKDNDMEAIGKSLAQGFQSVHQNGASDREQEITLVAGLKLGDYTLSNIKITRNGPAIVATYLVTVAETLNGVRLEKQPAPRLSVFLHTDGGWQWLAHANLIPMQK